MLYNDEQQRVIASRENCVVVAIPGSGKTRMMIGKIAALLGEVRPSAIVAVTFTRMAAGEMQERLAVEVGEAVGRRVLIGTFHSIALNMLKRTGRMIRLLSPGEQYALLDRARDGLDGGMDNEEVQQAVAYYKARLRPQCPESDGSPEQEKARRGYLIYEAYQAALAQLGALDFDDLLRECVLAIQDGKMQTLPIKHLLVDEFQDTDEVQLQWILAHAQQGVRITVVGDDDQSIYAFRNALGASGMERILQATQGKLYFLSTNYRCREAILRSADQVIQRNGKRIRKALIAHRREEADIDIHAFADEYGEADAVVSFYAAAQQEDSRREFAVLARTNDMLDLVETVARSAGVPVARRGGGNFLARPHVVQALSLIRAGVQQKDVVSLTLAAEGFGLSQDTRNRLERGLSELHVRAGQEASVVDLLFEPAITAAMSSTEATLFREFRSRLCDWIEAADAFAMCKTEAESQHLAQAISEAVAGLMEHAKSPARRADLHALVRLLGDRLSGPLARRLHFLQQGAKEERNAPANALKLLTLHSAKGLEFEGVWIIGCNRDKLPHKDADKEEERRLFYVGMTRAKDLLRMSYLYEPGKREHSEFLVDTGLPLPPEAQRQTPALHQH